MHAKREIGQLLLEIFTLKSWKVEEQYSDEDLEIYFLRLKL
jgi:hypothetical protein